MSERCALTDSSTSVQRSPSTSTHGVGGVLDPDRPEVGERALLDVEQRRAHDRIVRDEQGRDVDAQDRAKARPAGGDVAQRFAVFERHVGRPFAPGRVARRIVGRDLVAQAAFPGSVRDLDQRVVGFERQVQAFGDERGGCARALHRARDDARRRRIGAAERVGQAKPCWMPRADSADSRRPW